MLKRSLLIVCIMSFLVGSCAEKKPSSVLTYQQVPTVKISKFKTNDAYSQVLQSEYFAMFEQDEQSTHALEMALKEDPNSTYLKVKLARQYAKSNRINDSIKLLNEVLAVSPNDLDGLFLYARILAVKGDFDQSKTIFLKILDLDEIKNDPERKAEVSFILASLYIEKEEFSRAEIILKNILADNPEHLLSYYYLGRIYSEQNRMKDAIETYQKSVELDPRFSLGWRALGLIYEYSDKIDDAIVAYERVIGLDGSNVDARTKLIDLYLKKGQPKKAIEQVGMIKKMYPNVADVSLRLGLFYYQEKMFSDAETEFSEALQKFKTNQDLYYYLALTQYQLKKKDLAEKNFSNVGVDSEMYPVSQLALASLYEENNRSEKAQRVLEKALSKKSNSPDIRVGLANLLIRKKNFDQAQKILEDGLAISSKEERYYLSLAEIFERKKQYDRLEKILYSLLGVNPNNANALNFLGYSYVDRNIKLKDAEEMIKKALQLKPNDSFIQDSMGWLYYRKKDYVLAEEMIKKALQNNPEEPIILEHLGDILLEMGRAKEAKEIYVKSLQHQTEAEKRGQIENKIKAISR